jgi:hypothetical protein
VKSREHATAWQALSSPEGAKASGALLLGPLPASALFVGSVLAAAALFERLPTEEPLRLLVVALPLPFLVHFLFSLLRSFRHYDAQQRSLLVEALTFALLLTLFALLAAELLQLAGVPVWHNEDVWPYLAFAGYIFGYWGATRRNR